MAPLVRSTSSMSLVPMQYRSWWDDWDLPLYGRMLEKSVTQEVLEDHPYFWRNAPLPPLRWSSLWRPWRYFSLRDVGSRVDSDREKFLIEVDVHQFAPHEVTVRKTDKYVTIEGKHEEKRDELGYVARQFSRRYMIPIGYDANLIVSSLSSDGVLTVTAPRIGLPAPKVEKFVPIWHTGKPAIEDKNHYSNSNIMADEKLAKSVKRTTNGSQNLELDSI